MNIASLIPSAGEIPVHWGWLWFFLMLTFTLHLLFMNAMLGTGIIALVYSLTRDKKKHLIDKEISTKLPTSIAFTVNMGVPPLLFIQVLYGQFFYTSSILMAVYWLSIVMIVLIAYYSAYLYDFNFDISYPLRSFLILLSVVLLLAVGFLFTNNLTLMLSPEKWRQYFTNPGGTLLNLSDATLLPRYLHFVTASVANGGLFLAILYHVKDKRGDKEAIAKKGIAMKWVTGAMIINIFLGFWFFLALPGRVISVFMGGHAFAPFLLLLGLTGTGASIYFSAKRNVVACTGTMLLTLIVMVLMRDMIRTVFLEPYFTLSMLKVNPQYGPMVLFIISLVVGLSVIGYLLKLAAGAGKEN